MGCPLKNVTAFQQLEMRLEVFGTVVRIVRFVLFQPLWSLIFNHHRGFGLVDGRLKKRPDCSGHREAACNKSNQPDVLLAGIPVFVERVFCFTQCEGCYGHNFSHGVRKVTASLHDSPLRDRPLSEREAEQVLRRKRHPRAPGNVAGPGRKLRKEQR